jgi:hypothetical protein
VSGIHAMFRRYCVGTKELPVNPQYLDFGLRDLRAKGAAMYRADRGRRKSPRDSPPTSHYSPGRHMPHCSSQGRLTWPMLREILPIVAGSSDEIPATQKSRTWN